MTYQIENLKKLSRLELGAGDRLSRVIAKKGRIGNREMESQGCVIPSVSVSVLNALTNDTVGREYLCGVVASVQDALIRKAVENGKMAIFDHTISLEAMIDWMKALNESVRFSKESIKVWFDEYLAPILDSKIRDKYAGASDDKVEKMLGSYLASFQILAGRDPSMSDAVKAGLIRALEFLPEDHDTATANEIAIRLQNVKAPEVLAEML